MFEKLAAVVAGFAVGIGSLSVSCWVLDFQVMTTTAKSVALDPLTDLPAGAADSRLQLVDQENGWLHSRDKLWRSSDSGLTWEETRIPPRTKTLSPGLQNVHFFDRNIGWIWLEDNVFRTRDGGRTWLRQPRLPIEEPKVEINSIWFSPSMEVGWIGGGIYERLSKDFIDAPNNTLSTDDSGNLILLRPAVFRTGDGGKTWERKSIPFGRAYRANHLLFLGGGTGFVSSEKSVFYSHDKGRQWGASEFSADHDFWKSDGVTKELYFLDSLHGWLSFDDGYFFRSSDGGQSWGQLSKYTYRDFLKQIQFTSTSHGWAIRHSGSLEETHDGGLTWLKIQAEGLVRSMSFLDEDHGWINTEKRYTELLAGPTTWLSSARLIALIWWRGKTA